MACEARGGSNATRKPSRLDTGPEIVIPPCITPGEEVRVGSSVVNMGFQLEPSGESPWAGLRHPATSPFLRFSYRVEVDSALEVSTFFWQIENMS